MQIVSKFSVEVLMLWFKKFYSLPLLLVLPLVWHSFNHQANIDNILILDKAFFFLKTKLRTVNITSHFLFQKNTFHLSLLFIVRNKNGILSLALQILDFYIRLQSPLMTLLIIQIIQSMSSTSLDDAELFIRSISGFVGFPGGSDGKESACNAGDLGSNPRSGRSPGGGNSYPLQYSGLKNSMDSIVHGVTKSRTQLINFHFHQGLYILWN